MILRLEGRTICLSECQEASHLRMMEAVTGEIGIGPAVHRLGISGTTFAVQLWKGLAEAEGQLEARWFGLSRGWRVWEEVEVECLYREQSREGRSLAGKYGATASMTLCIGAVQEHVAMVPEGAVRCIALVDRNA